ncbi:hypothetical protein U1Q18_034889 [Sarracenia purpurea var. burkii]
MDIVARPPSSRPAFVALLSPSLRCLRSASVTSPSRRYRCSAIASPPLRRLHSAIVAPLSRRHRSAAFTSPSFTFSPRFPLQLPNF